MLALEVLEDLLIDQVALLKEEEVPKPITTTPIQEDNIATPLGDIIISINKKDGRFNNI